MRPSRADDPPPDESGSEDRLRTSCAQKQILPARHPEILPGRCAETAGPMNKQYPWRHGQTRKQPLNQLQARLLDWSHCESWSPAAGDRREAPVPWQFQCPSPWLILLLQTTKEKEEFRRIRP